MILQSHSGTVAAIQASPYSPHLASLGEDGRFFIYDLKNKNLMLKKEFLAGGYSLLWLPLTVSTHNFFFQTSVFYSNYFL